MKDELNALAQRVSDELSKYIYFLLAAAGAAIAYALDQLEGGITTKCLIPLALALLSWCGSFYFGVRHLNLHREHMIENANSISEDLSGIQMWKHLNVYAIKMKRASNIQYHLFIIGVVFYITGRISEVLNA